MKREVKKGVEQQLLSLEEDTNQLETLYEELKGDVMKAEVHRLSISVRISVTIKELMTLVALISLAFVILMNMFIAGSEQQPFFLSVLQYSIVVQ